MTPCAPRGSLPPGRAAPLRAASTALHIRAQPRASSSSSFSPSVHLPPRHAPCWKGKSRGKHPFCSPRADPSTGARSGQAARALLNPEAHLWAAVTGPQSNICKSIRQLNRAWLGCSSLQPRHKAPAFLGSRGFTPAGSRAPSPSARVCSRAADGWRASHTTKPTPHPQGSAGCKHPAPRDSQVGCRLLSSDRLPAVLLHRAFLMVLPERPREPPGIKGLHVAARAACQEALLATLSLSGHCGKCCVALGSLSDRTKTWVLGILPRGLLRATMLLQRPSHPALLGRCSSDRRVQGLQEMTCPTGASATTQPREDHATLPRPAHTSRPRSTRPRQTP